MSRSILVLTWACCLFGMAQAAEIAGLEAWLFGVIMAVAAVVIIGCIVLFLFCAKVACFAPKRRLPTNIDRGRGQAAQEEDPQFPTMLGMTTNPLAKAQLEQKADEERANSLRLPKQAWEHTQDNNQAANPGSETHPSISRPKAPAPGAVNGPDAQEMQPAPSAAHTISSAPKALPQVLAGAKTANHQITSSFRGDRPQLRSAAGAGSVPQPPPNPAPYQSSTSSTLTAMGPGTDSSLDRQRSDGSTQSALSSTFASGNGAGALGAAHSLPAHHMRPPSIDRTQKATSLRRGVQLDMFGGSEPGTYQPPIETQRQQDGSQGNNQLPVMSTGVDVVSRWTEGDVAAWAATANLDLDARIILRKINGQDLLQLTKADLLSMGLTSVAARVKTIEARDKLVKSLSSKVKRSAAATSNMAGQEADARAKQLPKNSAGGEPRPESGITKEVVGLLKELGLEQYGPILEIEGIEDIKTLKEYSATELKAIGILGGHAKKLLAAVREIQVAREEEEKRKSLKKMLSANLGAELEQLRETSVSHRQRLNQVQLEETHADGTPWEIDRQLVTIGELLGFGAFGDVHKGVVRQLVPGQDIATVAVKTLRPDASEDDKQDFLAEIQVMQQVNDHANVAKLLGICTAEEPMMILLEFMANGNLRQYLRSVRPSKEGEEPGVTAKQLIGYMEDVASGMAFLASHGVVHRDLAARNVLVDEDRAVVSDFGLSRHLDEEYAYQVKNKKRRLPTKWLAPECMIFQVFTSKSDVWAFGVTMWEILMMGAVPYPGISTVELFILLTQKNYRMPKPMNCSTRLYRIVQRCWHARPEDRPVFNQLRDEISSLVPHADKHIRFGADFTSEYMSMPLDDEADELQERALMEKFRNTKDRRAYVNVILQQAGADGPIEPLETSPSDLDAAYLEGGDAEGTASNKTTVIESSQAAPTAVQSWSKSDSPYVNLQTGAGQTTATSSSSDAAGTQTKRGPSYMNLTSDSNQQLESSTDDFDALVAQRKSNSYMKLQLNTRQTAPFGLGSTQQQHEQEDETVSAGKRPGYINVPGLDVSGTTTEDGHDGTASDGQPGYVFHKPRNDLVEGMASASYEDDAADREIGENKAQTLPAGSSAGLAPPSEAPPRRPTGTAGLVPPSEAPPRRSTAEGGPRKKRPKSSKKRGTSEESSNGQATLRSTQARDVKVDEEDPYKSFQPRNVPVHDLLTEKAASDDEANSELPAPGAAHPSSSKPAPSSSHPGYINMQSQGVAGYMNTGRSREHSYTTVPPPQKFDDSSDNVTVEGSEPTGQSRNEQAEATSSASAVEDTKHRPGYMNLPQDAKPTSASGGYMNLQEQQARKGPSYMNLPDAGLSAQDDRGAYSTVTVPTTKQAYMNMPLALDTGAYKDNSSISSAFDKMEDEEAAASTSDEDEDVLDLDSAVEAGVSARDLDADYLDAQELVPASSAGNDDPSIYERFEQETAEDDSYLDVADFRADMGTSGGEAIYGVPRDEGRGGSQRPSLSVQDAGTSSYLTVKAVDAEPQPLHPDGLNLDYGAPVEGDSGSNVGYLSISAQGESEYEEVKGGNRQRIMEQQGQLASDGGYLAVSDESAAQYETVPRHQANNDGVGDIPAPPAERPPARLPPEATNQGGDDADWMQMAEEMLGDDTDADAALPPAPVMLQESYDHISHQPIDQQMYESVSDDIFPAQMYEEVSETATSEQMYEQVSEEQGGPAVLDQDMYDGIDDSVNLPPPPPLPPTIYGDEQDELASAEDDLPPLPPPPVKRSENQAMDDDDDDLPPLPPKANTSEDQDAPPLPPRS